MGSGAYYKRSADRCNGGKQYSGAGICRRGDTNYRRGAACRAGAIDIRLCKAGDIEIRQKMTTAYNLYCDCTTPKMLYDIQNTCLVIKNWYVKGYRMKKPPDKRST